MAQQLHLAAQARHFGLEDFDLVGELELFARAGFEGFAPSEPEPVSVVAGQRLEEVELRLRVGGRLVGEVLGDGGAPQVGASVIVRGLRAVADFEYEFQMVGMNRAMDDSVETVFLMADARRQAIASKLVKEIARLGGDVSKFVTPEVRAALLAKFA